MIMTIMDEELLIFCEKSRGGWNHLWNHCQQLLDHGLITLSIVNPMNGENQWFLTYEPTNMDQQLRTEGGSWMGVWLIKG